jgi:hypothetical protein
LEPGGIVIQADLIEAAEGPTPLGNGRSAQVDAEGNVSVDGATFRTQSHRMSYDQAKDLLVLEGDGFNDAKLFRQAQPNAPPETTSARKFQYDIKRNRPTVDGVKSFEFRQMGPPNRQPAVPSGSMPGNNRRP